MSRRLAAKMDNFMSSSTDIVRSAMAEPPVSFLLEQLEELATLTGFRKEFAELSNRLEEIGDILLEAEDRQFVGDVVDQLKDLCYEVDGVLGDWRSAILMKSLSKKEEAAAETRKKVCFCITSSWFRCPVRSVQVVITAPEIRKLIKKVTKIAGQRDSFTHNTTRFVDQRPRTKPFIFGEVYGRESEKILLLKKLLSESSQAVEGSNYVIPIVGMAGIGKTTLAQLAYDDKEVKAEFECRIWVHVGQTFDLIKIERAIVATLKAVNPGFDVLESWSRSVEESIEGKRFLLILDDVWTEDETKWLQLKGSLQRGAVGSRIVVTTRKENVAVMMGAEDHIIRLDVLSNGSPWRLFTSIAFEGKDQEERTQLEEIGRRLVESCEGLPLFLKCLGRWLCTRRSKEEWRHALDLRFWDFLHPDFCGAFLWSYNDLSALEKRCLSYCSIFPKDYRIDRADLIELWLAQGYLTGNRYLEIGENCCKSLVMRSILQGFAKDFDGNATEYKLHGFLQFLVRKECSIRVHCGTEEAIDRHDEMTRHCTLLLGHEAQIPTLNFIEKKLRTLFVFGDLSTPFDLNHLLSKLSCLKTLSLHRCIVNLPPRIDKLLHLRYLNLTGNSNLEELPNELCNLLNLQTLRLIDCINLQRLPEKIRKLVNLRHLYIYGCCQLKELPKGVGRLIELRILDMFVVPYDGYYFSSNRKMKLEDLNELKHLQGKRIHIRNCGGLNTVDANSTQLKSKEYLLELELSFDEKPDEDPLRDTNELEILEALEPHPNLTSLLICYYHSSVFPVWMSRVLINLKRLQLLACNKCVSLPSLGRLPSLESLHVEAMEGVEKVGSEVLGIDIDDEVSIVPFPKLRELRFRDLPNWKNWEWSIGLGQENYSVSAIMPHLESLEILSCPKLEALPSFLKKTTERLTLDIQSCKTLEYRIQKEMEKKESPIWLIA